jgi:hypothetical protein
VKSLHEFTIDFIKQFARDDFLKLRGPHQETGEWEETMTAPNWTSGGFVSTSRQVEKVTFTPEHFSFNYKGAIITGPLRGVSVETQFLVDGVEADCEQDDIEAAVEKACGFALDRARLKLNFKGGAKMCRTSTRKFRNAADEWLTPPAIFK